MEQSIELRNLMLRYYKSMPNGDISFVENNFSQMEGVLAIGTEPNDWWEGYDTIVSVTKSMAEELTHVNIVVRDSKAYYEGTVGWAISRAIMKMPDGSEIPIRTTSVFHQENGSWKIIHFHHSIDAPNID